MRSFLKLFLLCSVGCSSAPTSPISETDPCEDILTGQPAFSSSYKVLKTAEQSAGYVVSYAVTGAAYVAEFSWNAVVSGGAIIVLCSPAIVASVAFNGGPAHGTALCIPADISSLKAPNIGYNTYRGTKELRCPELDELSTSFRKASQCYRDHGDTKKAVDLIHAVTTSKSFSGCLSKEEHERVLRLKGELTGLW